MTRLAALSAIALTGTLTSGAAIADERIVFGAGLDSTIGLAALEAPSPSAFTLPRSGNRAEAGGMNGLAFGAGVFGQVRLLSRIGLHVGAAYSIETLRGDVNVAGRDIDVELEHPALTFPLLLQGFLPLDSATPFLGLGVEVVVPTIPIGATDPIRALPVAATAESHVRLAAEAGVEFRLPLKSLDLRLPVALRGTWYAGLSDDLGDRIRVLPSDALIYGATPEFGLRFRAGIGMYF